MENFRFTCAKSLFQQCDFYEKISCGKFCILKKALKPLTQFAIDFSTTYLKSLS